MPRQAAGKQKPEILVGVTGSGRRGLVAVGLGGALPEVTFPLLTPRDLPKIPHQLFEFRLQALTILSRAFCMTAFPSYPHYTFLRHSSGEFD